MHHVYGFSIIFIGFFFNKIALSLFFKAVYAIYELAGGLPFEFKTQRIIDQVGFLITCLFLFSPIALTNLGLYYLFKITTN